MRKPLVFWCILSFAAMSSLPVQAQSAAKLIAGRPASETEISVGAKLVAVYEKQNYLIEILEVKPNKKVRIVWLESKEETDDVETNLLYQIGDAAPTRKSRTSLLPEEYRALDKNGDGQIGLYEWNRAKFAEFRKLDKNNDGFLTPKELGAKPTGNSTTGTTAAADAGKKTDENKPK